MQASINIAMSSETATPDVVEASRGRYCPYEGTHARYCIICFICGTECYELDLYKVIEGMGVGETDPNER